MRTTTQAGVGFALLAAATFGTSGTFASSLIATGWTPGAAVTVRVAIAALVLTPLAVTQLRGRWDEVRRNSPMLMVYGLFAVAGAQLGFFNAVEHLSVGVALLLEYSGVLLVVGWLWVRHGQRPRRLTLAGSALALAGLMLVLDLAGDLRVDLAGVLWGLFAAVGLAVFYVLSAGDADPLPPLATAWIGLVVGAAGLGLCLVTGLLPSRVSSHDVTLGGARVSWVVPVIGLSLVAAVVAYLAGIIAARSLGAQVASFIGLTEVLFAVLFAWLIVDQVPRGVQLVGGALVVGGIALVRIDDVRSRSRPVQAVPA